MPIVNHAMDHGLMGKGSWDTASISCPKWKISRSEKPALSSKGEGWDKLWKRSREVSKMTELKRNEKIDIVELLKDLDKYEPRRRGWERES